MACSTSHDLQPAPREPIYLIAGSKGGVGKSMLALVTIDQLILMGKQVLYFESDITNADVWMCMQRDPEHAPGETIDGVTTHTVRLEEEQSWVDIVTAIEEHPHHTVVIG